MLYMITPVHAGCQASYTLHETFDCSDSGQSACPAWQCYGYSQTSDPVTYVAFTFDSINDCSDSSGYLWVTSKIGNTVGGTFADLGTSCYSVADTAGGDYIDFVEYDGGDATCDCIKVGGGMVATTCIEVGEGCDPVLCQNGSGLCG